MADEDRKVSQNRVKKQQLVAKLSQAIEKSKGIVFTNYQGLTHKQLEELKKAIKPLDANFAITKNTLLKLALKSKNYELQTTNQLDGPTGTLFLNADVTEPLKKLAKMIKDLNLPVVKFGILDGKVVSGEDIIKLSALPSKEILLAMLVSGLKSPIFGLNRALSWNLQKLVMTLNEIEGRKSV